MVQRHWLCLPVLSAVLLMSGCVPNKIYRPGPTAVQTAPTLFPESNAPTHFQLGIVEFDDMGESLEKCTSLSDPNNCQLTRVLELIRGEKRTGHDVVVMVFTHGWKNNASLYNEERKNLHDFKHLMEVLALGEVYRSANVAAARAASGSDKAPAKPRSYIGVYMGWRGQVLAGDLALTFYNRRDAAARVGSSDYAEAIYRIMAATKTTSDGKPDNSRIVVVGHSFGGRALETAITNTFVSMLVPQPGPDGVDPSVNLRSPADLILYVNPATDSFRTKEMIELMKRTQFSVQRGNDHPEGPLFLSVTSTGDTATGTAFPLGQNLSALRKSFRPDATAPGMPSQKDFFTHTPGHVPFLYSHTVEAFGDGKGAKGAAAAPCVSDGPVFRFTADKKCYQMKPKEDAWNTSPFWVTTLPTSIIKDHSDIFGRGFAEMIAKLIDHYNVLDSPAPTTMARKQ